MSENPIFCCNCRISAVAPNGSNSSYHQICLVLRRGASLEILQSRYERGFPDMLWKKCSFCFIIFFVIRWKKIWIKLRKRRIRKIIGYSFLYFFLVFSAIGVWAAYILSRELPDPTRLSERSVAESTKIYDRTGEVILYEIHGNERRTIVPLSDIPRSMKDATIVAEDINFYKHIGLDWRGIIRAFFANLRSG